MVSAFFKDKLQRSASMRASVTIRRLGLEDPEGKTPEDTQIVNHHQTTMRLPPPPLDLSGDHYHHSSSSDHKALAPAPLDPMYSRVQVIDLHL